MKLGNLSNSQEIDEIIMKHSGGKPPKSIAPPGQTKPLMYNSLRGNITEKPYSINKRCEKRGIKENIEHWYKERGPNIINDKRILLTVRMGEVIWVCTCSR